MTGASSGPERSQRQRILGSAHGIVLEGGLGAVSVRAVAARAGIGASTMRHYFPTQRALHEALVTELVSDELSDARIDDPALPAGERLRECLLQFLPADDDGAPLAAWFALYAAALGPDQSALGAEFLRTSAAHAQERVRDWLRMLADEGALPTADVDHRAHLLVALVGGLCLEILTPGSPVTASEARHLLAIAVMDVVGK